MLANALKALAVRAVPAILGALAALGFVVPADFGPALSTVLSGLAIGLAGFAWKLASDAVRKKFPSLR